MKKKCVKTKSLEHTCMKIEKTFSLGNGNGVTQQLGQYVNNPQII